MSDESVMDNALRMASNLATIPSSTWNVTWARECAAVLDSLRAMVDERDRDIARMGGPDPDAELWARLRDLAGIAAPESEIVARVIVVGMLERRIMREAGHPDTPVPVPWTGTWCPECGPGVACDDDGCCAACGSGAVGEWAERALALERGGDPAHPGALRPARSVDLVPAEIGDTDRTDEALRGALVAWLQRHVPSDLERDDAEDQWRPLLDVMSCVSGGQSVARLADRVEGLCAE